MKKMNMCNYFQFSIVDAIYCYSSRQEEPFVNAYVDSDGVTWYPVWLYTANASPSHLYQFTDSVRCRLVLRLCCCIHVICYSYTDF